MHRARAFKGGTALWLALSCLLITPAAWSEWRQALPQAQLLGAGDFTWWGLNVYGARLWSAQPVHSWQQPFALELNYRRALSREALVEASVVEMRRLGGASLSSAQLARWAQHMSQAFVDVQPGQRITGVYLPNQGARFYVDGVFRHAVTDPDFARAFFSIWLDERARKPSLRNALLGLGTE